MTYGRRHYLTQQILVRLAYAGPSNAEVREFAKASARLVAAITLIFFGLVALAQGQELKETPTAGEFLYCGDEDGDFTYDVAPLVDSRITIDVTGVIARVRLVQRFRNPADVWVRGIYVFPLPENAAVDHMTLRAGDRLIEGRIREREQARREFETAAAEGKRASLVEQQRPNLFTTRVANLGPHEELEVAIEYQQTLALQKDRVSLRFPLAITPRYERTVTELQLGASSPIVQPPFVSAGMATQTATIEVNLNAGFDVAEVTSASHAVVAERDTPSTYRLRLRDGEVPQDRDFLLEWRPSPGVMPQTGFAREQGPDGDYALVTLFPPAGESARRVRIPREVTFVIDTSGSMEGQSMEQAKAALILALERLDERDTFNVIEFNSIYRSLFARPVPVTASNRARALGFATALHATGGTEMLPALVAALGTGDASPGSEGDSRLRQVLFLTDGAVSNEDELFAAISKRLGSARLFTVGIGSAPNTHFMSRAAAFGRGAFTYIADVSQVQEKMNSLFARVESPALSDIQVSFEGVPAADVEMWPARVPDLYLGEPLTVAVRLKSVGVTSVRVKGRRAGEPFEMTAPFAEVATARGIGVLWARQKVSALQDGVIEGLDPEAVRQQIVDLGLTHHIVTPHTSLVAVDITPVRPAGAEESEGFVPVSAPAGTAFGSLPQSATPASLYLVRGLAALVVALGLYVAAVRS